MKINNNYLKIKPQRGARNQLKAACLKKKEIIVPTVKQKERRRDNRRLKAKPPIEATRSSFPTTEELMVWLNPSPGPLADVVNKIREVKP